MTRGVLRAARARARASDDGGQRTSGEEDLKTPRRFRAELEAGEATLLVDFVREP
jgi:hypothetical protein